MNPHKSMTKSFLAEPNHFHHLEWNYILLINLNSKFFLKASLLLLSCRIPNIHKQGSRLELKKEKIPIIINLA